MENKKQELILKDLDCADCAVHLEESINALDGVKHAKVDFFNLKLNVEFDSHEVDIPQIRKHIKKQGYDSEQPNVGVLDALFIEDLDCADEALPIEAHLKKIAGIQSIRFNLLSHHLFIEHTLSTNQIIHELRKIGFEAKQISGDKIQNDSLKNSRLLVSTIFSGFIVGIGFFLELNDFPKWSFITAFALSILIGGAPIFRKGLAEARNFRLGMNFLMSIAVIGAMFIDEWSEAAVVVFLFILAQLLESYSIDRARNSIKSLLKLTPNIALKKTGQSYEKFPVEQINPEDVIVILPGDRIPLDGTVVAGESTVNQAPITGESMPVSKRMDDTVFAGTINERGTLEVKVTKPASETLLSRIIHLVEEAQSQKAPTQAFIEKFARYYTPAVVSLAVCLAALPPLLGWGVFSEWFYRALVLLVISCPCALVISTPVTIVSSLTNAARQGILIKGGAFLEEFHQLKAIAFDKTGTLTHGKPQVKKVYPLNHHSEAELLQIAGSIEARSEHPLARAIVDFANENKIELQPISDFEAITGKGARAKVNDETFYIGHHRIFEENGWCEEEVHPRLNVIENRSQTAVMIGNSKSIIGVIAIADQVREGAKPAISELQATGLEHVTMLTGDNPSTARSIAQQLGIQSFKAELLPEDKVNYIHELKEKFGKVAMVGDGINDAPALAAASIGISMGTSGTDTALETADIVLMKDDLSKLAYLKKLSKKTIRIIKQNIFIALFLKGIFVILAIPGLATLWMAVFADMGASLIVITNGLRGLKSKNI